MLNRVLVQFTVEDEVEYLARFIDVLKNRYKGIDICGLYVRNTDEYLKYNSAMYSDAYYQDFLNVWKTIEDKKEEKVREEFKKYYPGCEFISDTGYTDSIVLNHLRLFDLLVLAKQKFIGHEIKALLSAHHKPLIIVPSKENYSMDKILMADDERLEVNKSLFNFMYLFEDIREFDALGINIDKEKHLDLGRYMEKVGKRINYEYQTGHVVEKLLEYSVKYGMIIIGDLKHSFLMERIAGKTGLKFLEKTEVPLFIG